MARKKISDAVEVLRRRYVKDDPERKASIEAERVNAQVARLIHDLRVAAKLSQQELAELIGTTQSVISRLEDSDYDGHSLSMLTRIAAALNRRLTVVMSAKDPSEGRMGNMRKGGMIPGEKGPHSGQYLQVGPRGGAGKEVTVVKGDRVSPAPPRGRTCKPVAATKNKPGKGRK